MIDEAVHGSACLLVLSSACARHHHAAGLCLQFSGLRLFGSFAEARQMIRSWIAWYNEERPHQALGYRSPQQYAQLVGEAALDQPQHLRAA